MLWLKKKSGYNVKKRQIMQLKTIKRPYFKNSNVIKSIVFFLNIDKEVMTVY